MFKLALAPKFWSTVKAEYSDADGSRKSATFDVEFKRMQMGEALAKSRAYQGSDDADLQFLGDVVTGWRGIAGEDGNELAFTPENLERIYQAGFAGAVVATFFRALPRAKEKN